MRTRAIYLFKGSLFDEKTHSQTQSVETAFFNHQRRKHVFAGHGQQFIRAKSTFAATIPLGAHREARESTGGGW